MKKKLSVLIALIVVLAIALPVLASCKTEKVVQSLDFDNPQKNYKVGDTIDYDNWKVKITYTDGTSETKTVKDLVALGATLTKADLSKEGNPTVYLVYKEVTARVVLTVTAEAVQPGPSETPVAVKAFAAPKFYSDYLAKSAKRAEGAAETQSDFRITGEAYEVGTANKFIFKPTIKVLDLEKGEEVELSNPATVAKVYAKATESDKYAELTGEGLKAFVSVDDNTYHFTKDDEKKFVKMEISLDETKYDVTELTAAQKVITVEFVLVDDGYNVYDQLGLSVMADLEKMAWSEIWKCDTVVEGRVVKCIARDDSIKLTADDKPLCEYVDKVSTVILHDSITLDADQMPSLYFWTSTPGLVTSDLYQAAYDSLEAVGKTVQVGLVGTLRGGDNSADENDRNYMRVIDTYESSEATEGDYKVYGQQSIETDIWLNMQKALFATKKVSVSGNYQSLFTPEKGQRSATGRLLEVYVDWNHPTGPEAPDTVYSLFHMLQSKLEGADVENFTIKNLALKGNNPKANTEGFVSAGLMILDSYNMSQAYYNVNASQFCRMMSADDYGVISVDENGKVGTGTQLDAKVNYEGVKFYDAYSNMFAMWRSTVDIKNSEMIGSGGPLFIMNDGTRRISNNPTNTDDTGCELTADEKSVLQAYAVGSETWYAIWNASPLFSNIGSMIEPVMNALGKTLQTSKNNIKYYNVIAAMICSPGDLFDGAGASNANDLIDVRGKYMQYGETFAMHNPFLVQFRQNVIGMGLNASAFAPIIQSGSNMFALTGSMQVGDNTLPRLQRLDGTNSTMSSDPAEVMQVFGAEQTAWASNNSKLACIYMSAGAIKGGAAWAPYFAIVLELNALPQA